MQDRTINNALQATHKAAMNGQHEGLEHILALMRLRGVEPTCKRPSPIGFKRRETRGVVLDAIRDGVTSNSEITDRLMQVRPDLTRKQAGQRVYMVVRRMGGLAP